MCGLAVLTIGCASLDNFNNPVPDPYNIPPRAVTGIVDPGHQEALVNVAKECVPPNRYSVSPSISRVKDDALFQCVTEAVGRKSTRPESITARMVSSFRGEEPRYPFNTAEVDRIRVAAHCATENSSVQIGSGDWRNGWVTVDEQKFRECLKGWLPEAGTKSASN